MKQKLSITIEEEKINLINEILKKGIFRNKSHLLEYSLDKLLEGKRNG